MKKSFPVNINGRIYNIDEDAYALLSNYLDQLHATFPGEEGNEIVSDIEARVAELFEERLSAGSQVIDIDDVNRVIAIMGRPEDLGDAPVPNHPPRKVRTALRRLLCRKNTRATNSTAISTTR